ncbi:MAG: penicillin-binding protein 1C, partial [Treponema sp.]|nr:penicillin-binding protein 1C [Treponema sp.]
MMMRFAAVTGGPGFLVSVLRDRKGRRGARRFVYLSSFLTLLLMFLISLPDPLFEVYYSPVLRDREGRLLGAMVALDGQWRFPPGEKVNEKFAAALIEAEDRRFARHPGIDPAAVFRAFVQNIRAGRVVSGGSTLTMQTIRLARPEASRSVPEKITEAVLALRLEMGRSKDEILALYSANAPFGANVVGLEAASWRWFGRSSEELSWAEAAVLAVLPNGPGLIHPGRNRDLLGEKRDALLERLFRKGLFDEETLFLARAEPLPGEPLPLPQLAPHLLARLVGEAGGTEMFKSGGVTAGKDGGPVSRADAFRTEPFITTLDRDLQERAAAIMNRAQSRFSGNGIMNGACLIMDTASGEIAAYVGNTGSASKDVDIVTASRSSGSILKPFLYAAMLDSGDILPSSLVSDIPTRIGSYGPENITRAYLGAVPAGEALARSLNVPAVRSLRVYGVERFARFLEGLGVGTLFRPAAEYGLPLILGGAEVNLWEMTGLYGGLARSVNACFPAFFPPTVFPRKEAVPSGRPGNGPGTGFEAGRSSVSPGAAWLTLEALTFAARPGEEAQWQEYAGSRRIAWKTGTSFGNRDAWAIGVRPDWTVAVWIGNASGEGRAELRSALTASPVLFELFSALGSGPLSNVTAARREGVWFSQPASRLKSAEVCAFSGFPAGPDCRAVKTVSVPAGAPPHNPCPYCVRIVVNEEENLRVNRGASGGPVKEMTWFVLPPAEEWYFRRWNLDYRPLPPAEKNHTEGSVPLALFNPGEGSQVYVPRELDGSEGRVVFSAAHRENAARIYWHLDGVYLGESSVFHEMEARPG